MGVLQSCIAVLEVNYIEIVADEGNAFDMSDNERVMVPEELNDNGFAGANGDDAQFWLRLQIYFHLLLQVWATPLCHPY